MNRKERFFIPAADDLLWVAIVSGVLGLGMTAAAADLYRSNVEYVALLSHTAANDYRVDIACAEVSP